MVKMRLFYIKVVHFCEVVIFRTVFEKAAVQKLLDICPKICNIICIMDESCWSINCKPPNGGFFVCKGLDRG